MKKRIWIIFVFCFVMIASAALAGCGKEATSERITVVRNYIDERGHIIVEYSDGVSKDLGEISGLSDPDATPGTVDIRSYISKTYLDESNHIIIVLTDGTVIDMGDSGIVIPTAAPGENVSVKEVRINEELHAIAEMTDGSIVDLGYVGVEVVPPKYTVTFLDADGKTLSVQQIYKGESAEAPAAPKVADATFDKWDADYTNVQGDLMVRPVYIGAARFTVTFLDDKGNTISTQEVISGHAANEPTPPSYEDKVFDGWDKSFSKVTADLTVTATYRAKKILTVTFNDYSGVTLGTATVKEGETAKAPVTPSREGYNFDGWSGSLKNITSNKTVTAEYSLKSGSNIFDVSYSVSGSSVTVTFRMAGSVKFCGMEGSVKVPSGLTYQSLTEGDGATANYKDGTIYFMFASNNGKNVTSSTTVMTVKFKLSSGTKSASLGVTISDIYDQDYNNVTCKVIGKDLTF